MLAFEAADVLERVAEVGDLYAENLELEQELPRLGGKARGGRPGRSDRRATAPGTFES